MYMYICIWWHAKTEGVCSRWQRKLREWDASLGLAEKISEESVEFYLNQLDHEIANLNGDRQVMIPPPPPPPMQYGCKFCGTWLCLEAHTGAHTGCPHWSIASADGDQESECSLYNADFELQDEWHTVVYTGSDKSIADDKSFCGIIGNGRNFLQGGFILDHGTDKVSNVRSGDMDIGNGSCYFTGIAGTLDATECSVDNTLSPHSVADYKNMESNKDMGGKPCFADGADLDVDNIMAATEESSTYVHLWGRGCGHIVFQDSRGLGCGHTVFPANYDYAGDGVEYADNLRDNLDIADANFTSQLLGRGLFAWMIACKNVKELYIGEHANSFTVEAATKESSTNVHLWCRGCGHTVFQASRGLGCGHIVFPANYDYAGDGVDYADNLRDNLDIADADFTSQLLGRGLFAWMIACKNVKELYIGEHANCFTVEAATFDDNIADKDITSTDKKAWADYSSLSDCAHCESTGAASSSQPIGNKKKQKRLGKKERESERKLQQQQGLMMSFTIIA